MSEECGPELPRGWAVTPLAGLTLPRTGKANPQAMPEAMFIGMEQVEAHTMRILGTVPASSMKSNANVFRPYDVLYGRLRAYLNKVCQPDFAGLCSGEFIVMPESPAAHGRFLKYRLNAGDFVRFASQLNTGDRPRVDWDQIKSFTIGLPPIREQERIADTLDELLSDLDAGVAALERVRTKLKHYRSAVLKAAVEGTLTAEWRRQHPATEPACELLKRILAERRRRWEEAQLKKFKDAGKATPKHWESKYSEPTSPSAADLPSLPEGWCWASIGQLSIEVRNGYSAKPDSVAGVPILRISAVRAFALNLDDRRFLSGTAADYVDDQIAKGDLLFTRYNGSRILVGVCAVVPRIEESIVHPDKLIRARPVPSQVIPEFIGLAANVGASRQYLERRIRTTAGQAGISGTDVKALPVPLPPAAEQAFIVDAVEDQLSVVQHVERDLEAKLKSAQALRQSILRHAFTGQLVPQDPNDEPASELLKRIAAEREERARLAKAARQAQPGARTPRRRAARN